MLGWSCWLSWLACLIAGLVGFQNLLAGLAWRVGWIGSLAG
jgi:hypothetical protein